MDTFFNMMAIPVFAIFIGAELLISFYSSLALYHFKDTAYNLICSLFNVVIDLLVKGLGLSMLLYLNQFAPFHISNVYLYWFLLFLAEDFAFWFMHWVDHHVRFFWAVHVTHHSAQDFNFTVAIRSSVFQPVYRNFYYIPLALAGFNGMDILLMFAICNTYGFFIHTKLVGKLGILEKIFATPSNHRVHHASNVRYLDKNLGMVLIIWDRIFNTYEEEHEAPVFGLTTNVDYANAIDVVTHEWKNLIRDVRKPVSFRDKLMYIFGPPGWSHDGSSHTSKIMRQQLAQQQTIMEQEEALEPVVMA